MTKYVQREDGEGFEVPSGEVYRLACCECGLVHDMVFVSEDGKPIGIAARRNNRATAQRKKRLMIRPTPKLDAESAREFFKRMDEQKPTGSVPTPKIGKALRKIKIERMG